MNHGWSGEATIHLLLAESGWLRSLARGLVGAGAADDVVQETWIAALRHRPHGDRPLRPWLGQQVVKMEEAALSPIRQRMKEIVKSVADSRKLLAVVDKDGALYVNGTPPDLTDAVIRAYDQQSMKAASRP